MAGWRVRGVSWQVADSVSSLPCVNLPFKRRGSCGNAAEFGGAGFGVGGGSHEGGAAFEDDADGHVNEQLAEAALVGKGLQEGAVLELFEDARAMPPPT